MRRIAVIVAVLALAVPASGHAASISIQFVGYEDSCNDFLIEGSAGPSAMPTARCSAEGSIGDDRSFAFEGMLSSPANGYAPGLGTVWSMASAVSFATPAESRPSVDIDVTVRIDRAWSNRVTRLGLLAPRLESQTILSLTASNESCGCVVDDYHVLTDTHPSVPDEVTGETVTLRVTLLDPWDERPVEGPISISFRITGEAQTGIGGVGSATYGVEGHILSIAVA